jgi:hypothetical protein
MNRYVEIYSISGLEEMISDNKKLIQEKQQEYTDVCDGKRYNPNCAEEWKKNILDEIKEYEEENQVLEEALEIKKGIKNA